MKKSPNLLPPQEQATLRVARINERIFSFAVWLILSIIVLIVMLLVLEIFLQIERRDSAEQIAAETLELTRLQEEPMRGEAILFARNLDNFEILRDQEERWSKILVELSRILPKNVSLDSIKVSRGAWEVELTGHAATRDDVLQLRKNILASEYFEQVDFPLANIENELDVSWAYSFVINPEILK